MNMPVTKLTNASQFGSQNNIFSTLTPKANQGTLVAQVGFPGGSLIPVTPLPIPPGIKEMAKDNFIRPKNFVEVKLPGVTPATTVMDSEVVLSKLREQNRIGRLTRSPQMPTSVYEQYHSHLSNVTNRAGLAINALTATRSKLTALYGAGLASASDYQLSLARLNGEITKIRAVVDMAAGEVALLNYQNAGSAVRTRMKSLDTNLKSFYATTNAAQKQIGIELQTVDKAVAQLRASGSNEIAASNRKLNTAVNKVLTGANKAIESNMQPGRAIPDKNGNIPVPALVGDVVLTDKQRTQIGEFYNPLRKLDIKTINALNPQVAGQPRLNVDALGSEALQQKSKLAELVKKYGSLE